MPPKFTPNPGFFDEVGNSPEMRRLLLDASQAVVGNIARNLPVGKSQGRRVAPYARRAFTEIAGVGRDTHGVAGTKWRIAPIIEWGTVTSPAYGVLRKAVSQAGLKFEVNGR